MERSGRIKMGSIGVGILLLGGLVFWYRHTPTDRSSSVGVVDLTPSEVTQDNTASDADRASDLEPGAAGTGRHDVDINAVVVEIGATTVGEEAVLDEESADETASVKEGQAVLEKLGQGYDETAY